MWFPTTFEPGKPINLFSEWSEEPLDEGFLVSLPPTWKLTRATAVRQSHRHTRLTITLLPGGEYHLSSSKPLPGSYELVLQILTEKISSISSHRILVAPAVKAGQTYVPNDVHMRLGELHARFSAKSGSVLTLREDVPSLHISSQQLEALNHSHTLELWIQTTALNSVVLSTWDGSETHLYPMELVIDARGRMRYYRNTGGHHISLATESPVADGSWHHIALTYDAENYWTRLYLNGQVADSLRYPADIHLNEIYPIALGGRIGSPKNQSIHGFSGELDDLRIWPSVRTFSPIRQQNQTTDTDKVLVLDFESAKSFSHFQEPDVTQYRTAGGPIEEPITHQFHGIVFDQGVMLTWKNEMPNSDIFWVERSQDGREFIRLARIEQSYEGTRWSYTDTDIPDHIVFYRLIRDIRGQGPQIAGMIKLGLGSETAPASIELLGNYPNPFNPRTSITYEVQEPQNLQLSIINLSGHIVTELIAQYHETGVFEAIWDGAEQSSGTYFVRIRGQDGIVKTRQILLTK